MSHKSVLNHCMKRISYICFSLFVEFVHITWNIRIVFPFISAEQSPATVAHSSRRDVPNGCAASWRSSVWANESAEGLKAVSRRVKRFDSFVCGADSPRATHFLSGTGTMAAAAAAVCGQHSAAISATKKPPNSRRNRENSRRRQAALLFLSNISLDGRPVQITSVEHGGSRHHTETNSEGADLGHDAATAGLSTEPGNNNSYFTGLSASCVDVKTCPAQRSGTGLLSVPPILVLPSDTGLNDVRSSELLLDCRRGSVPSPGNSNLLSPSPSNTSLLPSPLGPRKSSTLLSVQSCNSVSSEPRQRWEDELLRRRRLMCLHPWIFGL